MPAAVALTVGDQRRGVLELAGHPTRYSQTKVRGVRKRRRQKLLRTDRNSHDNTTDERRARHGFPSFPFASDGRGNMAAANLGVLDSQDRVQQLIKLAEDGRKKSNTLPPLEREVSFARQPRKGGPSLNTTSQSLRDSEEKPFRKVSIKMDRKIVSHLKVHLNKRLQRRFDPHTDRLEYPSDEDGRDRRSTTARDGQTSGHGEKSIFTHYSETGEKIQGSDGRRLKASKSPSRSIPGGHRSSVTNASLDMGGHSSNKDDQMGDEIAFVKNSPLPAIPSDGQTDSEKSGVNGFSHNENGIEENELNEEDIQLLSIDDDVEVEELDYRLMDVSPVQTPSASRPQSGVTDWTTVGDHLDLASEVLSGSAHVTCPPDRAIINLYIAAGYSDTEAERFFMQEHLYPDLRAHCMHHGHELRVHDLHWGFKDAISDDHRVPDVMHKVICEVQDSMHGINFVILLGQRTGPCVLPANIPQEELEKIALVASMAAEAQRADLKVRIAEVEAARSEREAKTRPE
ncbi:hypothetical protein EGW08_015079, partial [Elysia chlorotica]